MTDHYRYYANRSIYRGRGEDIGGNAERGKGEGRGTAEGGGWKRASERVEGRGRWDSRGRGYGRGGRGGSSSTSFNISTDGKLFFYPRPEGISSSASILTTYSDSLKLVGCYSEDSEGNFTNDRSYLSFLDTQYLPADGDIKEKSVNIDLTVAEGEGSIYSGNPKRSFNNFLQWIVNNPEKFKKFEGGPQPFGRSTATSKKANAGGGRFVLMKNSLSKMVTTPFMYMNDFIFYATYIAGTTYIVREQTPADKEYNRDPRISNWAHKYEQYMTGGDKEEGVVCNQEFRCILTTDLGPHKLLYSTSTDCANPDLYDDDMEDLSAFVSLKCTRKASDEKQQQNLVKFKMLNWYFECLTTGIPKVLVGYRDDGGKVDRLQLYQPDDMLLLLKNYWDPSVAFRFASEFLSYVKKRTETQPGSVFRFTKERGRAVIASEVDKDYGSILPECFFSDLLDEDED